MPDAFEELVGSLLWEGYALYPYTRGSAKNATPTPFGIVYPQVYANATSGAFASLVLRGVALAGPDAPLAAEVRFLQASGPRHEAAERRVSFAARPLAELATEPDEQTFEHGDLRAVVRLSAQPLDGLEPRCGAPRRQHDRISAP